MLKCKINTKQLENALRKLEVIRPNIPDLKILENIKLETVENKIILTSTNLKDELQIYITDVAIEYPGVILLNNIKNLMKSFKYFKAIYTNIELHNSSIIITNDNKTVEIKSLDITEFPKNINIGLIENEYKYNTKDLYNRIKKIEHTTSKEDFIRPILEGIHFNNSDIVALDGYRLALSTDNNLNVNNSFTIASNTYKALLKLLDKKNKKDLIISHNDKYIRFKFDNMILTSELLEGEYYDYNQIIPRDHNTIITVNKKELLENNEFLSLYSKDVKYLTVWTITEDNLNIKVNTAEGIYNTNNSITFEGEELTLGLNNGFVIDVLKSIEDEEIIIKFVSATSPILIETEKEKYLILPVRLENTEVA